MGGWLDLYEGALFIETAMQSPTQRVESGCERSAVTLVWGNPDAWMTLAIQQVDFPQHASP